MYVLYTFAAFKEYDDTTVLLGMEFTGNAVPTSHSTKNQINPIKRYNKYT